MCFENVRGAPEQLIAHLDGCFARGGAHVE